MAVTSSENNLGQLSYARLAITTVLVATMAAFAHALTYFLARYGFFGSHDILRDLINDALLVLPMLWLLNNLVFKKGNTTIPRAFALRTAPGSLRMSICFGLAGYVLSLFLVAGLAIVLILTGFNIDKWSAPGSEALSTTLRHGASSSVLLTALVQSCFTGVAIEESFFRGFLFNCLRAKLPFLGAAFISAILWAVAHQSFFGIFYYLPAGLILAFVYEKSGRLASPLITHGLWNLSLWYINAFLFYVPKF